MDINIVSEGEKGKGKEREKDQLGVCLLPSSGLLREMTDVCYVCVCVCVRALYIAELGYIAGLLFIYGRA